MKQSLWIQTTRRDSRGSGGGLVEIGEGSGLTLSTGGVAVPVGGMVVAHGTYLPQFTRTCRPCAVGAELLRTPTNMPGQYSYTFMAQSTHTTIAFEEIVATNSTILLCNFTLQEVGGRYVAGFQGQHP